MSLPSATPPLDPTLQFHNPAGLYDPIPNGYSHLAIVRAPARLILVAGQGGEDAGGHLPGDFAGQVRQALQNLLTALRAAGAGLGDVARITVLIVDHSEERLHLFGHAWQSLLGDLPPPPCTLIPVPRLALDGMLFEIEATAMASP
ncbi:RidA family protein [Pseudoxanthomonas wuyuanensis]